MVVIEQVCLTPSLSIWRRRGRSFWTVFEGLYGMEVAAAWGWRSSGFGAGAWRGADRKPSERHPLPDPLPQMQERVEFSRFLRDWTVWKWPPRGVGRGGYLLGSTG